MKTLLIIFAIFAISQSLNAQAPLMVIQCNQVCIKARADKNFTLTYQFSDAAFFIFTDSSNGLYKIEGSFEVNKPQVTFYIYAMSKSEDSDGFSVYMYVYTKDDVGTRKETDKSEYIRVTDGKKNTTIELMGYGTKTDWNFITDPILTQ